MKSHLQDKTEEEKNDEKKDPRLDRKSKLLDSVIIDHE